MLGIRPIQTSCLYPYFRSCGSKPENQAWKSLPNRTNHTSQPHETKKISDYAYHHLPDLPHYSGLCHSKRGSCRSCYWRTCWKCRQRCPDRRYGRVAGRYIQVILSTKPTYAAALNTHRDPLRIGTANLFMVLNTSRFAITNRVARFSWPGRR